MRQPFGPDDEVHQHFLPFHGQVRLAGDVLLRTLAALAQLTDDLGTAGQDDRVHLHFRTGQIERCRLTRQPQPGAGLRGHVRAGSLRARAQQIGELRGASPQPQRGPEQRRRLARRRLGSGVAHERRGERRERVERIADQSLGNLRRRVGQDLAQLAALEEAAGGERGRLGEEGIPGSAQLLDALQRRLGGIGFVAELAAQLGAPPQRVGGKGESQIVAQELKASNIRLSRCLPIGAAGRPRAPARPAPRCSPTAAAAGGSSGAPPGPASRRFRARPTAPKAAR